VDQPRRGNGLVEHLQQHLVMKRADLDEQHSRRVLRNPLAMREDQGAGEVNSVIVVIASVNDLAWRVRWQDSSRGHDGEGGVHTNGRDHLEGVSSLGKETK